jgi:hypothetical protein
LPPAFVLLQSCNIVKHIVNIVEDRGSVPSKYMVVKGLQWGHRAVSVANQASEGAIEIVESDVKTQRTGTLTAYNDR